MWEPVGPLPASVYWRRRWLAIASVITAVGLIAATVALLAARTATSDITTHASGPAVVSAPQQAPPPPAAGTASSLPPSQSGAVGPASDPVGLSALSGQQVSPSSTPATSEELFPDDTPRQSVPVPPPVPVPPTGPVPCTNAMISVGAEIDRPEHRVGERPVLRLVVTNISDQPCIRDLDSARQEIVVWSTEGARVWSSNDCVNASSTDLRTLVPGQPVAFAVRWAGRTSTPGCAAVRTVVPPGPYRVMTRVDDAISTATPFVRLA